MKLFEKHVAGGRSTPGAPQKNTVEPDLLKAGKQAHQLVAAKKGKKQ